MKIRQALVFCLMAVCSMLPTVAHAETPEDVMRNAAAKIMRAPSVTLRFTASGQGGSTQGTLIIAGRRFSMVGPDYGVWYNGQDLWSYSAQTGETNLTNPTQRELLEINPLEIINNYAHTYNVKGKSKKEDICEVELTPIKKKGASIKKVSITVNIRSWLPTEMQVTFANGQKMKVVITSSSIDSRVPARETFDYPASRYPGVPVIDLR